MTAYICIWYLELITRVSGIEPLSTMSIRVCVFSSIGGLRRAIVEECLKRSTLSERLSNDMLCISEGSDGLDGADVVVADPGLAAPIINTQFTNMIWLQSTFAGVNLLMDSNLRRNYTLCRIGRGFGEQMAEYTMGWILALQIKVPETIKNKHNKQWDTHPFKDRGVLVGKTLGILGAGQIGTSIAAAARAFGLLPLGLIRSGRTEGEESPASSFHELSTSMEDILAKSDYIVNCLPSTPSTRNVLTLPLLQATCGVRRPVFINIGRGDVISTSTIINALEAQLLSHCVLDVVETEPLPQDSPLWDHPSVTITPHISALSYPALVAEIFVDNLDRYVALKEGGGSGPRYFDMDNQQRDSCSSSLLDEELLFTVDWKKGY